MRDPIVTEPWEVQLPIHPAAVGHVRHLLRLWFADTLTPRQLADAELVVSELVGAAIAQGPPAAVLTVTGQISERGLRLTVQDDRPAGPSGVTNPSLVPGTMSYRLVSAMAEAFGEIRVNDVTIVWCELPLDEPSERPAGADTRAP